MKKFVVLFNLVLFLYSTVYSSSHLSHDFSIYRFGYDITNFSTIFEVCQTDSVIFTAQRKNLVKKSPWVALVLAVGPGFFIHGLGHFYAGKPLVGSILLICEIVGIGLIAVGIVMIAISGAVLSPGIILTALTGTPVGISEAVAGIQSALGFINIGGILFIGSWWIDIVGAPLSCAIRNRKLQKNYETTTIVPLLIVRF